MPRAAVLVLVIALGLATSLQASAATGPGNQKTVIRRAALALFSEQDRSQWRVQGIKVSTPGKRWAIASMNPKPAFEAELQSFIVVLVRVPHLDDSTSWVVADFGNAFVGCDVAPVGVLRDLYGSRTPCAQ